MTVLSPYQMLVSQLHSEMQDQLSSERQQKWWAGMQRHEEVQDLFRVFEYILDRVESTLKVKPENFARTLQGRLQTCAYATASCPATLPDLQEAGPAAGGCIVHLHPFPEDMEDISKGTVWLAGVATGSPWPSLISDSVYTRHQVQEAAALRLTYSLSVMLPWLSTQVQNSPGLGGFLACCLQWLNNCSGDQELLWYTHPLLQNHPLLQGRPLPLPQPSQMQRTPATHLQIKPQPQQSKAGDAQEFAAAVKQQKQKEQARAHKISAFTAELQLISNSFGTQMGTLIRNHIYLASRPPSGKKKKTLHPTVKFSVQMQEFFQGDSSIQQFMPEAD